MARTARPRQEEDFFREVDKSHLESGWSCFTILSLLVLIYLIGFGLLWFGLH